MEKNILVVDDNEGIVDILSNYLEQEGFIPIPAFDGEEAINKYRQYNPALILLDILMPKMNGFEVLKEVRKDSGIPIIMITAKGEDADIVMGLEMGADDYVVKPFSSREFLARVGAVLRRTYHQGRCRRVLVSGSLTLDLDKMEAAVGGQSLALPPKEYAMLQMFLKRRGHVLSFSVIAESVWGANSIIIRDTIKATVCKLRGKLGPYGANIKTVVGQGYKWSDSQSL